MADMQPQVIPQQQMMYPQYYQQSPYNPFFNNQQRLQQMEQMYPHLSQQYQQQPMQNQQAQQPQITPLKGRAVTGIDEAKASTIDFDGSVHLFTDIANGNIYTKQIGLNGTAEFNIYKLQPKEVKQPEVAVNAITQNDLNILQNRIVELETKINKYGEMLLNGNQSDANNANVTRKRKSDANVNAIRGEQSGDGTSD